MRDATLSVGAKSSTARRGSGAESFSSPATASDTGTTGTLQPTLGVSGRFVLYLAR